MNTTMRMKYLDRPIFIPFISSVCFTPYTDIAACPKDCAISLTSQVITRNRKRLHNVVNFTQKSFDFLKDPSLALFLERNSYIENGQHSSKVKSEDMWISGI